MTVLRTFVLRSPEIASAMVAFVKEHAADALKRGQPLQVTVARYRPPRTPGSNRYMWGAVLEPIAQQVCVHGAWFTAEVWSEHFKQRFLPEVSASGVEKWTVFPDGTRVLNMGTSDLNSEEMGVYLQQVQAYATTELGVEFDARN